MHPKYRANFLSTNAEDSTNLKPIQPQLGHVNPAHHPHLAKNRMKTPFANYSIQDIHIPGLDPTIPFHPMQHPMQHPDPQTQTQFQELPQPSHTQYSEDLEKLKRLKEVILAGQHPRYKPIPQPDTLASLYLGTGRLAEPSGASDVSTGHSRGPKVITSPTPTPTATKSLLHRIGPTDPASLTSVDSNNSRPASRRNSADSKKLSNGFGSQSSKSTESVVPAAPKITVVSVPEDASPQPLSSTRALNADASSYVGSKRVAQSAVGGAAKSSTRTPSDIQYRHPGGVSRLNDSERESGEETRAVTHGPESRPDAGSKTVSRVGAVVLDTPIVRKEAPSDPTLAASRPALESAAHPNSSRIKHSSSTVPSRLSMPPDDKTSPVIPMETSPLDAVSAISDTVDQPHISPKEKLEGPGDPRPSPPIQKAPQVVTTLDAKGGIPIAHLAEPLVSTSPLRSDDAAIPPNVVATIKSLPEVNSFKPKLRYPDLEGPGETKSLTSSSDRAPISSHQSSFEHQRKQDTSANMVSIRRESNSKKQSSPQSQQSFADRKKVNVTDSRPIPRNRQPSLLQGDPQSHQIPNQRRREPSSYFEGPLARYPPGPGPTWPPRDESRSHRSTPQVWDRERPPVDRRTSPPRDMLIPHADWVAREDWDYRPPRSESPSWEDGSYRTPRLLQRMTDFSGGQPDDIRYDPYVSLSRDGRYTRPRSPSPMHRPGLSSRPLDDLDDGRPSKRLRDDVELNAFYPGERDRRAFPVPYDYPPRPGSPGYSGIGGTLPPHDLVSYRQRDAFDRPPVYDDEYRRYPTSR